MRYLIVSIPDHAPLLTISDIVRDSLFDVGCKLQMSTLDVILLQTSTLDAIPCVSTLELTLISSTLDYNIYTVNIHSNK